MFCMNCGTRLPDGANVCPQCGTPVNTFSGGNAGGSAAHTQDGMPGGDAAGAAYGQYANPAGGQTFVYQEAQPVSGASLNPEVSGLSIASLVLGIGGILFCWVPVLGFVAGLLGLIFGIVGYKRSHTATGIVAIILSSVALLFSIVFTVVYIVIVVRFADGMLSIIGNWSGFEHNPGIYFNYEHHAF